MYLQSVIPKEGRPLGDLPPHVLAPDPPPENLKLWGDLLAEPHTEIILEASGVAKEAPRTTGHYWTVDSRHHWSPMDTSGHQQTFGIPTGHQTSLVGIGHYRVPLVSGYYQAVATGHHWAPGSTRHPCHALGMGQQIPGNKAPPGTAHPFQALGTTRQKESPGSSRHHWVHQASL